MSGGRIVFSASQALAAATARMTQSRQLLWDFPGGTGKPRKTVFQHAEPGDLFWVAEPFIEYTGRRDASLGGIGYGTPGRSLVLPPHLRKIDRAERCRSAVRQADRMARFQSRLTLEITAVRRESLQMISAEDALAEGIEEMQRDGLTDYQPIGEPCMRETTPESAFLARWHDIHRGDGSSINPQVAVLSFVPHLMHVDAFEKVRAATAHPLWPEEAA